MYMGPEVLVLHRDRVYASHRHRDPATLALLEEEEAAEQHALEVLLDEDAREVRGRLHRQGQFWIRLLPLLMHATQRERQAQPGCLCSRTSVVHRLRLR